ncbi:MAG: hypothetical protein ACRD8O_23145 [Bryobacteraceae bacterium]
MFSISLIVVFSLILFVYWFRYSCLLILQTRSKEGQATTASATGLSYAEVQQRLGSADGPEALDKLHQQLRGDFRIVSFLLRHSSDMGVDPIEQRMLLLDYQLMQIWFRATRRLAPPQARRALDEMSTILGYFAQFLGRNALQQSEA